MIGINQPIALYFGCEMAMCVLYGVAAGVLFFDVTRTPKGSYAQVAGQKILTCAFFCMSIFYFLHVLMDRFTPHTILENSYFDRFLLLHLAIFPILLYFQSAVLEGRPSAKKWQALIVASFCCLLASLYIGGRVDSSIFTATDMRYLGGALWMGQLLLYAYLIYRIGFKAALFKQPGKHKMFIYVGAGIGVAAFPLLLLSFDTLYWLLLQVCVWITHIQLFMYIFTKDHTTPHLTYRAAWKSPAMVAEERPTYVGSGTDLVSDELYQRLVSHFEAEKPYLIAGVNVADIAAQLFTNKTYLSRLLNDKLNQNFNQFMNAYRVKEAKRIVVEEGPITLSELCKKVGFTSMATFTVAFKLNTGMTPGEWCKKQKHLS